MHHRSRLRTIVAAFVVASTIFATATTTGAATPSDSTTVRDQAIAWLAEQVTDQGAIISAYTDEPDPSLTAQAALGFAGAGAHPELVAKMIGFLQAHVEDFVAPFGSADSPGALAWLILDLVATDGDAGDFGGVDLPTRLLATQQASGLFGSAPATYDGTFRQGLSLIALHALGETNDAGIAWLLDQQCANGGFVAFRADTTVPCPPVDPSTFSGPDTNSTAFAAIALFEAGETAAAADAMQWLESVRTPGGGFAYLGDATLEQDANSTGLVALAFRTVTGSEDSGSVAALGSLQVPQSGDPSDRGGVAFQAGEVLYPDLMATTQAVLGLAGQALPFGPVTEPTTPTTTPTTTSPSTTLAGAGDGRTHTPVAVPVSAQPAYTG